MNSFVTVLLLIGFGIIILVVGFMIFASSRRKSTTTREESERAQSYAKGAPDDEPAGPESEDADR